MIIFSFNTRTQNPPYLIQRTTSTSSFFFIFFLLFFFWQANGDLKVVITRQTLNTIFIMLRVGWLQKIKISDRAPL